MAPARVLLLASTFVVGSLAMTVFSQDKRNVGPRDGLGRAEGPAASAVPGARSTEGLLASEQVRRELRIRDEQARMLDDILATHRRAARALDAYLEAHRREVAEDRAIRENFARKRAALLKKSQARLAEVLDDDQVRRIREIFLQLRGADALVTESLVASLKLSDEQVERISAILQRRDEQARDLQGGQERGDAHSAARRRAGDRRIRMEAEAAALDVLSEEQRKAYGKLRGAGFELDRRAPERSQENEPKGKVRRRRNGADRRGPSPTEQIVARILSVEFAPISIRCCVS